jgi:WG containing repeat
MKLTSIVIALLLVALPLTGCARQTTDTEIGSKQSISENSELFRFVRNDKIGYIDRAGKIAIPPKFDLAENFSDGLALVKTGEKFGYIDRTGKIVISPKFDRAENFSEGLATVEIGEKAGYIDRTGKIVISPKFDRAENFSEGLAVVKIGEKFGYIDKVGKLVIPARFDDIDVFQNGIAYVSIDDVRGFIDRSGNFTAYPTKSNSVAVAPITTAQSNSDELIGFGQNNRVGYMDRQRRIIVQPKFDRVGEFREGLAWVVINKKLGYIDKTGKVTIPLRFDDSLFTRRMGDFDGGLAKVCLGKCGYIDRTGKIVIPLKFDDVARKFSNGLAWVEIDRRLGYIDRTGKVKIPPQFAYPLIRGADGSEERIRTGDGGPYSAKADFDRGLAAVMIPGTCGSKNKCARLAYIDTTGKVVFEFGSYFDVDFYKDFY